MKSNFNISYRILLIIIFTFCSRAIAVAQIKENSSINERPNILFFLVDDQRNDVLSCEGHPIVKTPTVDQLAKNGVRFTNAFVTTSICAASRASILTGLYETKHNYTFGKDPIATEFTTQSYPYLLKKSGYSTGFIGKFGVRIDKKDSILAGMFDFYKPSPRSTPHFKTLADGTKRHSAEIKGDQAIEFIGNQTSNKPFCLSISFNAVHAVDGNKSPGNDGHYPYPKAVAHLYEDMEMPKPDLSDPQIFEKHPDFMKNSMHRERFFWRWDTEEKYQTNLKAYFRMISGYDNVMKRVIASLEKNGLDKNTIIIFSSDNGYYMGNRGFAGKWSHYEESLRVPMVIYDPRVPKEAKGKISDNMALNIDIPATILDYAGISLPQLYQGESLSSIVGNKPVDNWRKNFMIEHRLDNQKIPKYVGTRGERYVYANYYEQEPAYEYLHDLEKDPDQLENLINNDDYNEILLNMRSQCKKMENELK
ncbi:MAG: arylsulfatase A-like enzyme [Cyclobacteriaceae bacterium]|jgi:arylsulfatase A-like enzyme